MTRRGLIHAFVALQLLVIAAWALPTAPRRWDRLGLPWVSRLHEGVRRVLAPYAGVTGLTSQRWRMFSNHAVRCAHLEAEVTFADGSRRTWTLPPTRGLGLIALNRRGFLHKWAGSVTWTPSAGLRLDAARFVARRFRDSPVAPTAVSLVLRWSDLELPRPIAVALTARLPDPRQAHEHPHSRVLLDYDVTPDDLRR